MSIYTYEQLNEAIKNGSNCDNDIKYKNTMLSPEMLQYFKRRARENRRYNYLITFTLKPEVTDEDEVEAYIIKQLHRTPLQIIEAHLSKEYTKAGRAHWHVPVTTTTPLKKDRFNYYIKKYGNIDISKNKSTNNLEESLNYINKETQSRQIIPSIVP